MIAPPAFARLTSLSVMPPTPAAITLTRTFSVDCLISAALSASAEPWTSALRTIFSSLDGIDGVALHHVLEGHPRRRRELALAELLAAVLDDLLGDLVVLGGVHLIAGLGDTIETEHFDRRRRTRFFERVAAIVEHRADLAEHATRDEHVAGAQRAFLDQDRRHRTAVAIEARLDHETGGRLRRGRP